MLRERKMGHGSTTHSGRSRWPIHNARQAQVNGSDYDTLCGVIVQYEHTQSAVRTIKSSPVNPKGRNILYTIQALSDLGYKTSRIEVIPGQPTERGDNVITEQQLSGSQTLEYLAFTLFFEDNQAGVQYLALGRQFGPSGERDSPQFGYKVGLAKGKSSNGELQAFLNMVKTTAFDYDNIDISPINPAQLPRGQPFI